MRLYLSWSIWSSCLIGPIIIQYTYQSTKCSKNLFVTIGILHGITNNSVVVSVIYKHAFFGTFLKYIVHSRSISCHTLKFTTANSRGLLSSPVPIRPLFCIDISFDYLWGWVIRFKWGTSLYHLTLFLMGLCSLIIPK